jgi:phospholipid transport system substrate-binding protein
MIGILRRCLFSALFGLVLLGSHQAVPAVEPGAPAVIKGYCDALLDVMKHATTLGFAGRYEKLKPAIEKVFNLPLMTRLAVGPQWSSLTPEQQKQVTDSFIDLTISTYASRFDGYDGERFEVSPDAKPFSGGVQVESRLVKREGAPVDLDYLMRESDGSWKAIDVFLSGTVSELATRRAEFASVLRRDGAAGLLALLQRRISEMKKAS